MDKTQQQEIEDLDKKIHTEMLFMNKQIDTPAIKGYDFNQGVNYELLFKSYATTGLQAYNLSKAI
jgi:deoxyhypusine synthase